MELNGYTEIEGLFYKDPYIVFLAEIECEYAGANYTLGYAVLNTETGVLEFQSPSLPDCISLANQSAGALKFYSQDKTSPDVDTSFLEDEETVH